ncbi:maleylacetoacetate isomerase [Cutaneotrichosporon oleaginosum]|uniref:Maleylacetoacetate isomerase n=1 Tax=Cutaneotrichosporon oleaginosum TaxID=879819 RepID=A0A0J0XME6_9TREE|nr:maleylacetoacetate isomerase [Cutaneotrichosporon oleaginosum]KLT42233.1 maleylacetoacetate isomerase [Cutaneotrichosporon oleaginosum]TXT11407.1 hypothetical protein COLE_01817 [Cutaneotrichosporon oleaginosum]
MSKPQLTLYTYFRSSAATRVRTLLSLQGTPYDSVYIHLLNGDQKAAAYVALNPSAAVPTLKVVDGADEWYLTQSAAILEYLDAVYGAGSACGSLMPADEKGKALVRSIIDVLVCDMQPLANLKTLQKVKAMGADSEAWAKEVNEAGLKALEGLLKQYSGGKYAYGDSLTLADVALAPQMYTCLRFGANLADYPTCAAVFKHVSALPEFIAADWKHQPDTPAELRA